MTVHYLPQLAKSRYFGFFKLLFRYDSLHVGLYICVGLISKANHNYTRLRTYYESLAGTKTACKVKLRVLLNSCKSKRRSKVKVVGRLTLKPRVGPITFGILFSQNFVTPTTMNKIIVSLWGLCLGSVYIF